MSLANQKILDHTWTDYFSRARTIGFVQHCDLINIIRDHQFGFRFKHSTQQSLSYLYDIGSFGLNVKNKPTVACALDLKRPLTVWVNELK